ncbi:FACT complex subunit pob-3 [Diaporthe helianthi]|uniref:FACT complex subunit POB3 n=1 Tax=Diaporthe helianthi TaxID=158607 RepID=A0A2P5I719_DIAHE|nr:FACT complex subunit pob-3 [Diaporthe helianthi]
MADLRESFDNIYLDLSKESGKCRFSEAGLGWKPAGGGDAVTLESSNIAGAHWSRASKGYEVKILQRNSEVMQLDGFQQEDHERLNRIFKNWYAHALDTKDHSLRGWNWGKAEFTKGELTFSVQNRPAFEIPYSEIANTNLAGRNEIAVELANNDGEKANGTATKGRKAAAGMDQMVEMRFYIPGTTTKKEAEGEEAGSDADEEEVQAAQLFYQTLLDKADIGDTAGDTVATFQDVLHLTPRGRFDIDMYLSSFRLRGKTYDYKVQYDAVKKFMVLPKPDDVHFLLTIGLDPPLRQGQTRYPFVVMQFKRDDESTIDLNMSEEMRTEQYDGKLESHYEEPMHQVVTKIFRGLSNKKVSTPAKDFETHRQQQAIKCSIKASEGFLYLLEKAFMFVPKPATYISYEQTQSVTFSRVSGAVSALSTFDITVQMKGAGSQQFSNISRDDLKALESFFKLKGLRVKNEIDEDEKLLKQALRAQELSSDEEVVGGGPDRGSADEDEESVDEDFHTESESDVAEEFDSDHESSGSGSGSEADSGVADDDEAGGDEDADSPPKKKKKTV